MTLTATRLRELLRYDPERGSFTWLVAKSSTAPVGASAGYRDRHGYVWIGIDGKLYLAHRLAWLYVHGEWPADQIDHRNRRKGDDRIDNLRPADHALNAQNAITPRAGRKHHLPLGVYPSGRRFAAKIMVGGKSKHLGLFLTPDAASAAYRSAKADIHAGAVIA